MSKNNLLKAAIFGLAVGDALGVPYEFRNRDTFTVTRMTSGGVHKQPKGTWSDDTGLTLATCYSIGERGGVDLADMMLDFRAWLWRGAFTVDGRILSHTISYKDCVLEAVRLGGNTDTIAAIAGGLAGIMYGCRAIPKLWLMQLRSKNIIQGCLFPVSG